MEGRFVAVVRDEVDAGVKRSGVKVNDKVGQDAEDVAVKVSLCYGAFIEETATTAVYVRPEQAVAAKVKRAAVRAEAKVTVYAYRDATIEVRAYGVSGRRAVLVEGRRFHVKVEVGKASLGFVRGAVSPETAATAITSP